MSGSTESRQILRVHGAGVSYGLPDGRRLEVLENEMRNPVLLLATGAIMLPSVALAHTFERSPSRASSETPVSSPAKASRLGIAVRAKTGERQEE